MTTDETIAQVRGQLAIIQTEAPAAAYMSPIRAIESVGGLAADLAAMDNAVKLEADGLAKRWANLKHFGGAREDRAAALLGNLTPHLRQLEAYCRRCLDQIAQANADPFGRNQ